MKKQRRFILALLACAGLGVLFSPRAQMAGFGPQMPDSSSQIAEEIVNADKPVLIDFWAVWCGPCRLLNPIIKDIEKQYAGKIYVRKINVDVHRRIAAYFQVSGIPAVFIVNNKTVVKYLPGLQTKQDYIRAINEVLAAKDPPKPEINTPADDNAQ
jgi:thioredoxin 1